jgi:hypothetical protein
MEVSPLCLNACWSANQLQSPVPTRTVRQVYTNRRGLRLPAPEDCRDGLVFTVAKK